MSRTKAAASAENPFLDSESGSLEAYLEGADEVVVNGDGSQPAQEDTTKDGDEEAGAPAESGADADGDDGDEAETGGDVEDLQRKLRSERRAKKALAKRLDQIERRQAAVEAGTAQHLQGIRDNSIDGVLGQAKSRVATLEAHVKAAQQRRRDALDSGDADRIMESDEQWMSAREALNAAKQSVGMLEHQAKIAKQQPVRVAAPEKPANAEEAGRVLARGWIEKNKWFMSQEETDLDDIEEARLESRALARNGITPDNPEHWKLLDRRMRRILPHRYTQADTPPPRKNGAPPMVNASERGGGSQPQNGKVDPNAITKAEAKVWAQVGRDIINNPDDKKEFLAQRAKSRAERANPTRMF